MALFDGMGLGLDNLTVASYGRIKREVIATINGADHILN